MLFQNGGIHRTKIDVVLDVSVVQFSRGKGWHLTQKARFDPTSCEEKGSGGPVIGSPTRVFFYPPTELTKGHQGDSA